MLYLYLDESGDLGFDFVNKKPSEFFTICVLSIKGQENDRALANAVKAVIRRKLPKRIKGITNELKGNTLPLELKKYFYKHVQGIDFQLYAVTLNKKRVTLPRNSYQAEWLNSTHLLLLPQTPAASDSLANCAA